MMDSLLIGITVAMLVGLFVGYFIGCLYGEDVGYKDGIRWNRYLFDHMRECDTAHKKERDVYRKVALGLCDRVSDCTCCPFEANRCNELCKLWEIERKRGLV